MVLNRNRLSLSVKLSEINDTITESYCTQNIITKTVGVLSKNNVIGAGKHANVYNAINIHTGKIYALKEIKYKLTDTQFIIDNDFICSFSHENIIICYEIININMCTYHIYEYMNLGSLRLFLDKHTTIPEYLIADITKSICNAIEYINKNHRLIHRDITPNNILLNSDGNIKLSDFGDSGIMNSKSFCTTCIGSTRYMAPERLLADIYGCSSDIWSLGLIQYECIEGYHPFLKITNNISYWDFLEIIETTILHFSSPNISEELKDIILKCTNIDKYLRLSVSDCIISNFIQKNYIEKSIITFLSTPIS
jgi:mitogen-activated protein kinase kinase